METTQAGLTGPEKAVLFLLSLDENTASPIVNALAIDELKKLREVASTMSEVSADAIGETYREFVERTDRAVAVPRGGLPYLRRLASDALGNNVASMVFEDGVLSPLTRLDAAPPEAVAQLLAEESPQLVGAILARLDPRQAYSILAAMPPESEAAVVTRIGKMSELPAGALEGVAHALANELPTADTDALISINGVEAASAILKEAGRDASTEILEKIEEDDPDLARDIRLGLFTFEELKKLDQRAMRTLLREVPTDRLTTALKGAPDDVARAIYNGLSQRAAKLIKDDLEVLGKVRKSEVEAARQDVIQVAMRLEAEGAVDLGRGDD